MKITINQLIAILKPVKYTPATLAKIADAINKTFEQYQINTPLRACHFLAQVLHESSYFKYATEIWGPTPAQARYDTREDLGNTPQRDGDGFKYRGRGWIQLTGKANYKAAAKVFNVDFVNNPDLAGQYPFCALLAGWYWSRRGLNAFADADNILIVTKKINGGYNGLEERKLFLAKCKKIIV